MQLVSHRRPCHLCTITTHPLSSGHHPRLPPLSLPPIHTSLSANPCTSWCCRLLVAVTHQPSCGWFLGETIVHTMIKLMNMYIFGVRAIFCNYWEWNWYCQIFDNVERSWIFLLLRNVYIFLYLYFCVSFFWFYLLKLWNLIMVSPSTVSLNRIVDFDVKDGHELERLALVPEDFSLMWLDLAFTSYLVGLLY